MDSPRETCAYCGRSDTAPVDPATDDGWFWVQVARPSSDDDCEFDETDLSFCSQEHAGRYLLEREVAWPVHDHEERTAGTRVDTFFLGCGLLAIILSVIGVVTIVRWIV